MLNYSEKNACVMTTDNIRQCLVRYQEEHKTGKVTLDNARRNLSSFFRWLEDENYIFKSPLRRIRKIKTTATVLETYIRDFFEDNAGKTLNDAIKCWKYKKSLKGHNRYEQSDLVVLDS